MTRARTSAQCNRVAHVHDRLLSDTGFDIEERMCLDIARLFFSTFAAPQSQNWMRAFEYAEHVFDHGVGPTMAPLILKVIQSIRTSRTSVFTFSNPDCSGCARILTEHERRLMTAITSARYGRTERAHIEMMMLCEGNDTTVVMQWLSQLADALPTPCAPLGSRSGTRV